MKLSSLPLTFQSLSGWRGLSRTCDAQKLGREGQSQDTRFDSLVTLWSEGPVNKVEKDFPFCFIWPSNMFSSLMCHHCCKFVTNQHHN